jgi:hypothetical protein
MLAATSSRANREPEVNCDKKVKAFWFPFWECDAIACAVALPKRSVAETSGRARASGSI